MKIEKLHSPHKELLRLQKYTEKLLKIKSLEPAFKFTLYQLHKDAMAALSFWQNSGKAYIQGKLSSNHDQLQIGGGKHYLPNFINLDLFPPADIIWDCRYGLPFADKSFSFIFSEASSG